jgi:hypothetical protein
MFSRQLARWHSMLQKRCGPRGVNIFSQRAQTFIKTGFGWTGFR